MGATCHLVVLETSAAQAYIFDTASRRESLGASHLVGLLGTWTQAALRRAFEGWTAADRLAAGAPAELVSSAGSTVSVLVTELEAARALVTEVTLTALLDAPGLDVCGVVEVFDWQVHDDHGALATAVNRARASLPTARTDRAREPRSRFLRLPIMASCGTTGLPASGLYERAASERDTTTAPPTPPASLTSPASSAPALPPAPPESSAAPPASSALPATTSATSRPGERVATQRPGRSADAPRPRSRPALAKLAAVGGPGGAYDRLAAELWPWREPGDARDGLEAVADFLERDADWIAVVHADGNDLGDLFRRLPEFLAGAGSDAYAAGLRQLSDAVAGATRDAARAAVGELGSLVPTTVRRPGSSADGVPVVLPLVLGDDGVTVVCAAEGALAFAAVYLFAFEAATRRRFAAVGSNVLTGLPDRATAAAGIAIVKPGYPFADAHRLAVDLTREAKTVKAFERESSALSFHVVHDPGLTTLAQVRSRTTFADPAAASVSAPASPPEPGSGSGAVSGAGLGVAPQLVRLVAQPYVVDGPASVRALGGVSGSTAWGARHRWVDLLARVDALRGLAPGSTEAHDMRSGLFAGRAVADARFDLVRYRYDTETLERLAPGGSLFWTDSAADGALVTGLLDAMDAEVFLPRPSASAALDRSAAAYGAAAAAVAAEPL